jgi:hypothetical protein
MTGRATGYCAGYAAPGYASPIPGRGLGWGRGWGRGWRRGFFGFGRPARWGPPYAGGYGPYWPPTQQQEAEDLQQQAQWLKDQLDAINRRIEDLGK